MNDSIPQTVLHHRLEHTDAWPSILAAVQAGRSLPDVAADHEVAPGDLQGALRRTGRAGRSRLVRDSDGAAQPEQAPAAIRKALNDRPTTTKGATVPPSASSTTSGATGLKRKRPSPALERVAKFHDLVGDVPDGVVASKAGVSLGTVRNYRIEHGIPGAPRSSWSGKTGKATTTSDAPSKGEPRSEEPAAAKSPAGSRSKPSRTRSPSPRPTVASAPAVATPLAAVYAWKVTFGDGSERYVVGDLAQAAARVDAAALGEVQSIERIGVGLDG